MRGNGSYSYLLTYLLLTKLRLCNGSCCTVYIYNSPVVAAIREVSVSLVIEVVGAVDISASITELEAAVEISASITELNKGVEHIYIILIACKHLEVNESDMVRLVIIILTNIFSLILIDPFL